MRIVEFQNICKQETILWNLKVILIVNLLSYYRTFMDLNKFAYENVKSVLKVNLKQLEE